MTNLPFSRALLCIALASPFAMTGCSIDDADEKPAAEESEPIDTPPSTAFTPGTHPVFDVALGQLPTVTDIPFLAAAGALGDDFDGTALVAAAADPVRAAINDLDGWSTNAYFDIRFSGSINPATVFSSGPGKNVFLFKLNTGTGDALDPESIDSTNPVAGTPSYTHSVVSLDGGTNNVIRIIPTAPLDPAAKYLVFLTSSITDGSAATTESDSYHALSEAGVPAINTSLQGISTLLNATETIAGNILSAATGGAVTPADARDLVTVSYTFTTTDPRKPLVAMAAPRAALVANGATMMEVEALEVPLSTPQARTVGISAATGVDLNTLSGGALAADVANLYTGHITLPYYQTAYNGSDYSYLTRMWRADTALATAVGITLPQDRSQAVSGGATTADGTTNVTYRYPFAASTGNETVPLQVTLPDASFDPPNIAGTNTCSQLYSGVAGTGYPTAIYIHGITSDRTSVVSLAHALAQMCIATVAIDLPVHGVPSSSSYVNALNVDRAPGLSALYAAITALRERHFEVVAGPTGAPQAMNFDTPNASIDRSGALFINLSTLQNTRDNLRQGVQDMLNLNASLSTIAALDLDGNTTVDLDVSKVFVIGVSLGGIIGTTFTTVNQLAIAQDSAAGFTSNLNPIRGLVVSAGGSQLSQILVNSNTFGPVINAGLTAAGVPAGTSNRESFVNVAQATVDSADPVNFAGVLDVLNVPTLVQMIVGGGDTSGLGDSTTWLTDQVVPNSAAGAPLMGTAPLAALLGATVPADGAAVSAVAGNRLVQLSIGYHSSLLIPDTAAPPYSTGETLATGELQTEVVSFIASSGSAFQVGQAGGGLAGGFTVGGP